MVALGSRRDTHAAVSARRCTSSSACRAWPTRAVPSVAASGLQPLPNVEQGPLSPGAQLLQPGVNASRKMPAFSTNVAGQEGGPTHTDV